jgi:hypothetical protein
MILRAPNIALFVVAGCLAMVGVLSALPTELPIPGLSQANAAWYIFWVGSSWRPVASCRIDRPGELLLSEFRRSPHEP